MTLKAWSEIKTGADGQEYGLRYLLTTEELFGLQKAGLVGEVAELVYMQPVADEVVASFKADAPLLVGRLVL